MVKGVSKTIIEVNNTGSRLFEKIVFYVTPEYGNLSAKQLKKAASAFSFHYDAHPPKQVLRKRCFKKRALAILGLSLGVMVLLGVILFFIL